MSRIGVKPINLPQETTLALENKSAIVKGPKGQLEIVIPKGIKVETKDNAIFVIAKDDQIQTRAFHGLTRALLNNAVIGVTETFTKRLELKGVGYKAEVKENKLVLNVGFSHPVSMIIPSDISITVEKSQIVVGGIDKQKVGQFAAQIRSTRPPEPYKGKGIRDVDEVIKLKPGKQAVKTVGTT